MAQRGALAASEQDFRVRVRPTTWEELASALQEVGVEECYINMAAFCDRRLGVSIDKAAAVANVQTYEIEPWHSQYNWLRDLADVAYRLVTPVMDYTDAALVTLAREAMLRRVHNARVPAQIVTRVEELAGTCAQGRLEMFDALDKACGEAMLDSGITGESVLSILGMRVTARNWAWGSSDIPRYMSCEFMLHNVIERCWKDGAGGQDEVGVALMLLTEQRAGSLTAGELYAAATAVCR